MRIAVISPHTTKNGNTTLAMLIALELANSSKRKTCIGHTNAVSNSFQTYLDFYGYDDKTSTPSQIVKLIQTGGIMPEDAGDYCKKVNDNLEAFTNTTSNFLQEDMEFMTEYIANKFPHEHIIFDVDSQELEKVEHTVNLCDAVVLCLTQSVVELEVFRNNKERLMGIIGNKPVVVVVNRFNSCIGKISDTAHRMGISKPNNWMVLHENPWIGWATNNGKLSVLNKRMGEKDVRVADIKADIDRICSSISRIKPNKKAGATK